MDGCIRYNTNKVVCNRSNTSHKYWKTFALKIVSRMENRKKIIEKEAKLRRKRWHTTFHYQSPTILLYFPSLTHTLFFFSFFHHHCFGCLYFFCSFLFCALHVDKDGHIICHHPYSWLKYIHSRILWQTQKRIK